MLALLFRNLPSHEGQRCHSMQEVLRNRESRRRHSRRFVLRTGSVHHQSRRWHKYTCIALSTADPTVKTTSFKKSTLSKTVPFAASSASGCKDKFRIRDKYGIRLSSFLPRDVSIHPEEAGAFASSSACVVLSKMTVRGTLSCSKSASSDRNAPFESSKLPLSKRETYMFCGPKCLAKSMTALCHLLRITASLFQWILAM